MIDARSFKNALEKAGEKDMSKSAESRGPRTWDSPEYITDCDARIRRVKIGYADSSERCEARIARVYKRTDPDVARGVVMSASSGPKDYFINDVVSLFNANELIEQIALLVFNGKPFLIVKIGPYWHDVAQPDRQVEVIPVEVAK